ncbi:MAG TPA: protein kinase [Vicinamibacterales bacterium]|nr:protein kinase [Vicinamibacterales bacterium]
MPLDDYNPALSLQPGVRLGVYEIVAPVGAGGMGEVYRAHDPALNRDVALKILPDAFAADPDRLARFTREAQVLASLNHPHIAHVYGLERRDGPDGRALSFIVMELVEGETLADLIAKHAHVQRRSVLDTREHDAVRARQRVGVGPHAD